MSKIFKLYASTNLVVKIVIGLVIGVILGLAFPQLTGIGLLGTLFVSALKAIAPVLVFVLVISSLANAGTGIGKKFRNVIALYMLSTFLAAVVAVIASKLFPTKLDFAEQAAVDAAPTNIGEVFNNLLLKMVDNPIKSIAEANYIGVLTWAVVIGLAIKFVANQNTKDVLQDLGDGITKAVQWVIQLAPFGIMGLVFTNCAENGISTFYTYGRLLCVLVGCMLAVALIVDPFIAGICLRKNPYPLVFKCFKRSGLTAFFTRSSAANIPVNMQLCKELGLDKEVYSVSIPLGATINMDGAAITITVMTLAAAYSMNIPVDFFTAIVLSVIAALGACGSSGVAGGSLLLIPMACSLFNISNDIAMQVVGIGYVISVVQDSLETAINSSGDVLFAATAEFMQWKKDGKEIKF